MRHIFSPPQISSGRWRECPTRRPSRPPVWLSDPIVYPLSPFAHPLHTVVAYSLKKRREFENLFKITTPKDFFLTFSFHFAFNQWPPFCFDFPLSILFRIPNSFSKPCLDAFPRKRIRPFPSFRDRHVITQPIPNFVFCFVISNLHLERNFHF